MNPTEAPQTFRPSPRLRRGDKVAIVAPSSAFDREAFLRGLARLQDRYEVIVGDEIFGRDQFFSGSDQVRTQSLMDALWDDQIRAIFCARGGYGAMRLLPQLKLPTSPKPLVGFSDITALHGALQTQGWRSIHGPVVTQLGRLKLDEVDALFQTLENSEVPPKLSGVGAFPGRCEGTLFGGNLSVLTRLIGTPFFPNISGGILFLEDVGEKPYALDRMMVHLALSGVLDRVSGVALGEFTNCNDEKFCGQDVVLAHVVQRRIPCVCALPVGHGSQNYPLVFGGLAQLDGDEGTLTALASAVV